MKSSQRPYGTLNCRETLTQGFTLGYFHDLPTGELAVGDSWYPTLRKKKAKDGALEGQRLI
jgi:hypothetical protein